MKVFRSKVVASLAVAGLATALALPESAAAHAFTGKQDVPIPTWLLYWGAVMVLVVSFVVLFLGWRTPRLQADTWRPFRRRIAQIPGSTVAEVIGGVLGVALLLLVVYSGLEGASNPMLNFSVTFVFVTFWLGLVAASVLFGEVFGVFNPWRAIARSFAGLFRLIAGQSAPAPLPYPERLGYLPAVAGVVGFVWLELIYGAGSVSGGLSPHSLAVAALVYSAITFVAMALFGIDKWIERGETFSVYFRMFSKLSVLEVRDGRLGYRRFLTGTVRWGDVAFALLLVLVSIGVTSFDGAQEGALATPMRSTFDSLRDLGVGNVAAYRINGSLWMTLVIAAVCALYALGMLGMHLVSGSPPFRERAVAFAHTLIPIALAYLVAHYFSLVVFQEQAQFTFLLSDPLGDGSDLFGIRGGGIDYSVISANTVWYVQVGALLTGHVAGLVLAHDRALSLYGDSARATISQLFMLIVMIGFTVGGLYLLSAANA